MKRAEKSSAKGEAYKIAEQHNEYIHMVSQSFNERKPLRRFSAYRCVPIEDKGAKAQ